jgi:voltage-gated potassium channel
MFTPLRRLASEPEGKVLLASAGSMLALGTVAYSFLEGWSPLNALYFSVVTLATVGFGDLTPTTDLAKLFTIGYIITGIGILAGFASELTKQRQAARVLPGLPGKVSEAAQRFAEDVDEVADDGTPARND